MEMTKTRILKNKPIYIGLSILEISKIVIYEFQYDCGKPNYVTVIQIALYSKFENSTKGIIEDVETRLDTSNYELNGSLQKGRNKKVIGIIKNEL